MNKFEGATAEITGEDYDHAVRVLRLKEGDRVNVFNRESGEFEAEIKAINTRDHIVRTENISAAKLREHTGANITAIIALIKKDNMEFVLEKMTELGIDAIVPLVTKRSVIKIKEEEKKHKRWETIIYSAVKQCGRISAPELFETVEGVENLAPASGAGFFIYEKEEGRLLIEEAVKAAGAREASFIIGPEGGFEESEAKIIIEKGYLPVSIGDTILRAETAAIAAGSVLAQALRRGNWKS